MPYAHEEASRKELAANRGGLFRIIHGEDPQLVTELRSILPQIPAGWQGVEIYAPPTGKAEESPLTQTWVLGETGELLIESLDGAVTLTWFREEHAPDGAIGVTASGRVLEVILKTILRYRAGGRLVH